MSNNIIGTDYESIQDNVPIGYYDTTQDQQQQATLYATRSAMRRGWVADLPTVLSALGLTGEDELFPCGHPRSAANMAMKTHGGSECRLCLNLKRNQRLMERANDIRLGRTPAQDTA